MLWWWWWWCGPFSLALYNLTPIRLDKNEQLQIYLHTIIVECNGPLANVQARIDSDRVSVTIEI